MKKTMFALSAISLATSLSLMSSSAFAYSSAGFSLTDFTYTITDLNPYDGITPNLGIFFDSSENFSSVVRGSIADTYTGAKSAFESANSSDVLSPFSPVSGAATDGSTHASAKVDAHSFSAQGYAVGHNDSKGSFFNAFASAPFTSAYFTLSPQTSITFTYNLSLTAASSADSVFKSENAYAAGAFSGIVYDYFGEDFLFGSYGILTSLNGVQKLEVGTNGYGVESEYEFGDTSFSYSFNDTLYNDSDLDIHASIESGGSIQGASYAVATPVPEPSTYAMLLAGLCLITFASRRNKNA